MNLSALNPFNWELNSKVRHGIEGLVYGGVAAVAAKGPEIIHESGWDNPVVIPLVVALLLVVADWARSERRKAEEAEARDFLILPPTVPPDRINGG